MANPDKKLRQNDTFVGSPFYVSPEMLSQSRSTPASDLWALGCIIYMMHVGQAPFYGNTELDIFNKILASNNKIKWPRQPYVSPQAKDLIEQLLKRNPSDRLGAGKPGSNNDFDALFRHVYFEKIDMNKLATQTMNVPLEIPRSVE